MNKAPLGWENYRTGETDLIVGLPVDFSDYIPQHPSAFALYRLYQEMGDAPAEAFEKVMELCVGIRKPGDK